MSSFPLFCFVSSHFFFKSCLCDPMFHDHRDISLGVSWHIQDDQQVQHWVKKRSGDSLTGEFQYFASDFGHNRNNIKARFFCCVGLFSNLSFKGSFCKTCCPKSSPSKEPNRKWKKSNRTTQKERQVLKRKKQLFTQEEKNFEEPPGVYKRETMTTTEGEWVTCPLALKGMFF